MLTRELLSDAKVSNRVHVALSAMNGLQFLRKEGPYGSAPSPDLVLLDINMPVMNGLEMLREMRSDPQLNYLPVIVLTSSDAEEDIMKCYELHANSYVVKPVDLDQFYKIIQSIDDFWLTMARFPHRNERL